MIDTSLQQGMGRRRKRDQFFAILPFTTTLGLLLFGFTVGRAQDLVEQDLVWPALNLLTVLFLFPYWAAMMWATWRLIHGRLLDALLRFALLNMPPVGCSYVYYRYLCEPNERVPCRE